jgi:hypothetical protein
MNLLLLRYRSGQRGTKTGCGGGDVNGSAPTFKGMSQSICICSVKKRNGDNEIDQFIVQLLEEDESKDLASRADKRALHSPFV